MSPRTIRRSPVLLSTLALLAVTAVWGSTFVLVKGAIERLPVLDFLAWRFALVTLAMLASGLGRSPPSTRAGGAPGSCSGLRSEPAICSRPSGWSAPALRSRG
ncbi:MAG: hypothetical protein NVSMB13_07420 [Mycobacteriales bacterium]